MVFRIGYSFLLSRQSIPVPYLLLTVLPPVPFAPISKLCLRSVTWNRPLLSVSDTLPRGGWGGSKGGWVGGSKAFWEAWTHPPPGVVGGGIFLGAGFACLGAPGH